METYVWVLLIIIVFILFFLISLGAIKARVKYDDNLRSRKAYYFVGGVDEKKKLERVVGKLVKKTIDKNLQPSRYSRRYRVQTPYLPKDYYYKYYITFETFEGYKSFTVNKEDYYKYSIKTYGYIYFQKSRFSHFEVRNRDSLQIDQRIMDKT